MDVVRYADTAGDNADYPLPEIRLYRDYIIDSFNADKPYDQFVREQLAGDLLARLGPPETRPERVVATGFLALSRRYATAPYELWHLTLEDTIETVGRSFMGLTLRCARCHDHKFDPVTTRDYYALTEFSSTRFAFGGSEEFSRGISSATHSSRLPARTSRTWPGRVSQGRKPLREQVTRSKKNIHTRRSDLDRQIESRSSPYRRWKEPATIGFASTERATLQKRHDGLRQLMADNTGAGKPDQLSG
jgi:hypothetical protein